MTKESVAQHFDDMEYPVEVSREYEAILAAKGLVVVFGASDDLIELRGAIRDEGDCYEGGTFKIDHRGILPEWDEVKDSEETAADYLCRKGKAREITANWAAEGYSWTYTTDIPHATFDIMDDGEKYCRGIIFRLADL